METKFDAAEAEPRLYAMWDAAGAFRAGANARPGADSFCIVIPPPNVTGNLHMGHAFNNTLQDILIRWHRMRGFDTLWQPGTDHAGIATQMVVERELARDGTNATRREMGREAFVQRVWQQKVKSRGNIKHQLERLGSSCDWSREAFTMGGAPGDPEPTDQNFHDAVIKVFVDLYNEGLIYRGKRLVNWDPHFETAISDLEVENVEVQGHMWHFKYPLAGGETYTYVERDENGRVIFEEERDWISIATTRPETMLGDGAVAVHPDDSRYAPIVGRLCEIPVGPKDKRRLIPIITDDYPDPAFGSGAVKITGAHDFNDYAVAERNGIPLYRLMDTAGRMRDDGLSYDASADIAGAAARGEITADAVDVDAVNLVPDAYRGLDRFEARKRIVADITAEGLAVTMPDEQGTPQPFVEQKPIMQPFGDRSKVVIEPMLTDQWFVDAEKIVGPAIEAVRKGHVDILPDQHRKVYFNWLENIEPWCISRQLWWGHRIPVWYGFDLRLDSFVDDEGDGTLDEVEMLRFLTADNLVRGGERHHAAADFDSVRAQFDDVIAALPVPLNHARVVEVADRHAAAQALAASLAQYEVDQDPTRLVFPVWRDPDVLDTWFSSGLWPIGTLGWPEDTEELKRYFPTSVLITGFDIIFFWVARMMMMQYAVVGERPFDTVYVHALVRDEKGKKMSKSLGNVLDPLDLIEEFGADAVRFTLASMAAMGRDLKLSKDRIAGYRNFGTKVWNAVRFAEMNGVYAAGAPVADPPAATATVNRWIIGETAKVREATDAALAAFRFNDAANGLYAFTWGKVCDWYLEFAKPLFDAGDPALAAETRATMGWVLDQCLILLHPIMPFVTEELWQATGKRPKMLIHADWPDYAAADLLDPAADREIGWVIGLIDEIRSLRAQMRVPAGKWLTLLQLDLDAAGQGALDRNRPMVERLARLDGIETATAAPKGALTVTVPGGVFALPVAGVIDVGAETARLEKMAASLAAEIASLDGRLANDRFLASAPEEVIEEARARRAEATEEVGKVGIALDRLRALG
jgi:valyl-tRNA synthetase